MTVYIVSPVPIRCLLGFHKWKHTSLNFKQCDRCGKKANDEFTHLESYSD